MQKAVQCVLFENVGEFRSLPSLTSVINEYYEGQTLMSLACDRGNVEIVKELLKYENIDVNKGVSAWWW